MLLKSSCVLMADYNQWMNKNIYMAASTLNSSELIESRGAFFGSIIGTLNHILVGDKIWLKRFAEHPSQLKALSSVKQVQTPKALDAVLHMEFDALLNARRQMDSIIQEFACELTDDDLVSSLIYTNTKGELFTKNWGHLILHFFNHQTHHRGQVSTLLSQAGVDVGVTDLLVRIPNE